MSIKKVRKALIGKPNCTTKKFYQECKYFDSVANKQKSLNKKGSHLL